MTNHEVHLRLTHLVKTERKITREILICIQQIDASRYYAELGYSSLYDYLTDYQKYSEGSAQRRISAARLLKELPEVEAKIQEGKINLTQLSKLATAIKQEQKATGKKVTTHEKKELIQLLESKNGIETEKVLSTEFKYAPSLKEKLTVKEDGYYLTIKMTEEQMAKFKQAQSVLSHSVPDGNLACVIEMMCDKIIQRRDNYSKSDLKEGVPSRMETSPMKSNMKTKNKPPSKDTPTAATAVKPRSARRFIPSATQKYVFHKAQHCCEYVSSEGQRRCSSRYQLQIDHIIPVARGGGNNPENLRVLCRTHNLAEARRWGLHPN